MAPPTCPYCSNPSSLAYGSAVYPHRPDLKDKAIYRCEPCGAHVGCHPGTTVPLGRLANAELRRAKTAAHAAFDPFWKRGLMSRNQAYGRLAEALGIASDECHIGMFDLDRCLRVVAICDGWVAQERGTHLRPTE